jgi:hypothetical protein
MPGSARIYLVTAAGRYAVRRLFHLSLRFDSMGLLHRSHVRFEYHVALALPVINNKADKCPLIHI